MDDLEDIMSLLHHMLDTKSKRHVVGGVLISVSLLFGGLAITAITIKEEQ